LPDSICLVAVEADHRSVQSDVNCSMNTPFIVVGYSTRNQHHT
jgi:hypothetical protein